MPASSTYTDERPTTPGYAATLRLDGQPVLVVGGGAVATRKVRGLLASGARVSVISPTLTDELAALTDALTHIPTPYPDDPPALPDTPRLVFAATDDPTTNARVAAHALSWGAWLNRADAPEQSTLHTPATARRGLVTLTIATDGASPALTRRLRARLERLLHTEEPGWAWGAALLSRLRAHITPQADPAARRRFWRSLTAQLPELARTSRAAQLTALTDALRDASLTLSDELLDRALDDSAPLTPQRQHDDLTS